MDESIKLATSKDLDFFKDYIVRDKDAYRVLGMTGIPDYSQENNRWNICFFIPKVGFIRAYYNSDPSNVYICGLYVMKSHRRMGVGKKLIEAVIEFAKMSWSYYYIYALTLENPPMENLLKSLKFYDAGTYGMSHRKNGKWISQTKWIRKGNI